LARQTNKIRIGDTLYKLESQIKVKRQGLLLCNFCVQEKNRSANYKTTHRLKIHVTQNHSWEIRILEIRGNQDA